MTWKVGPLLIAIATVIVRITGDAASADLLALAYLTVVTAHLQRASPALRVFPERDRSGAPA